MPKDDTVMQIVYANSGEENQVPLSSLVAVLVDFLDHFCVQSLVGDSFYAIVQTGDGTAKLNRLLDACGHGGDPHGFFSALLAELAIATGARKIAVNGIELPHLMLMAIMEVVLPGNAFISIKKTEQLEKLTNMRIPAADRADIQAVIDTYPVRELETE